MIVRMREGATGAIGLSKRDVLSLAGHPGTRIESCRGSLWVTQDGDRRDVVLAAGEVHVLDRTGPVLVQALDSALLVVRPAQPRAKTSGLWQRLAQAALSA